VSKLEDVLRATVKRGELTYLSLVSIVRDRKLIWSARYRGASEGHHGMAEEADPAAALVGALTFKPPKPSRKPKATADDDLDFG
jgi:hypothetical protein